MKILMATPYIGLTYGGPGKVVTELARGLGQAGLQVDLITTTSNGATPLEVQTNQWIDSSSYRVCYFPSWNRHDLIWSNTFVMWLRQHIEQYDLVHTHCLFMPLMAMTHHLCRSRQIPYLMTPHGMLEPWALAYKAWKKRLYYDAVEKPALRQAEAVHVLTSTEAAQVQTLGFSQTVVIPNGIRREEFETLSDPALFYQQFPQTEGKTLILFLGRIDPKKGLDLLASAFAIAHQQLPHSHLVVAGPDSIGFLETARQYFADAGVLDAVTFTGMLSGALKQAALAAATVYVAPSYSEGFSMSVLEGMASGLACVITKACNFPEAAEAGVADVVDATSDAIAQALIHRLAHPALAQAMGDRARHFMFQYYTWERIARQLAQRYDQIVTERSPKLWREKLPIH